MTEIVIGTAGHIDHGKTTLVKALSGIETDTTKEEKKRGMSINLGFAYLEGPNNQKIGLVDVPGHEKFIKNMVAGLPGIHTMMIVIDAAEGVMPQTKEHIDILTLLGINSFMIVLTKINQVDDELKELVIEDLIDYCKETPLEGAPIFETDAIDNVGIDALKQAIYTIANELNPPIEKDEGRLNVDRVFSVKGFGTVVTGTLLDKRLTVNDTLYLYPGNISCKIRSLQVHEQTVKEAYPGQRVAINLSNIATDEIQRGDVLSTLDTGQETWMMDVKVKCLANHLSGINLWNRVRILIGTREVFARVVPIGVETIAPNTEGFLQLRLEEPLRVKQGDHLIIRAYSPMKTIGGGLILDASPDKHRRFKSSVIESLEIKAEGSVEQQLLDFAYHQTSPFTTLSEMQHYLSIEEYELCRLLDEAESQEQIMELTTNTYIHPLRFEQLTKKIMEEISRYHKTYRLRKGMPIKELRSKFNRLGKVTLIDALLTRMTTVNLLKREGDLLALSDFEISFNSYQLKAKESMLNILDQNGYNPTKVEELTKRDKNYIEMLEALNGEEITMLTFEYAISSKKLRDAIQLMCDYIKEHQEMTLGDFRDLTRSSRKSSMLILEYIDQLGMTKRIENKRVLID
ncbi:selenocysteine-specific translation elongation factor [Vagococcus zengguangii]|uniref:Selenocysteine-specific elongation factor n=1 Tax=Vagococcus zengguangii TaxID=2571750 RepID=A0A4D7CTB9_9ENTE|nr:selenocysteine-specific translation elongation factor [Vagococcus zengguangii]QCI86443.1 selenocysteine-specific translation elongation factor [Vagococcus zengguangii]